MTSQSARYFRNVPEGGGGTFDRYHPTMPRIGTWKLITCAAVYFNVDKNRCFMAHLNGSSSITYPYNFVTNVGGREVQDRVVARLCGFLERDEWDVHDEDFGTFLEIVCPRYDNIGPFETIGNYMVEGVVQFLLKCAEALENEYSRKQASGHPVNIKWLEKAKFLRNEISNGSAVTGYHAVTIEPAKREPVGLTAANELDPTGLDLHGRIAVDLDVPVSICEFISIKDQFHYFVPGVHNSQAQWQHSMDAYEMLLAKFAYIHGDPKNLLQHVWDMTKKKEGQNKTIGTSAEVGAAAGPSRPPGGQPGPSYSSSSRDPERGGYQNASRTVAEQVIRDSSRATTSRPEAVSQRATGGQSRHEEALQSAGHVPKDSGRPSSKKTTQPSRNDSNRGKSLHESEHDPGLSRRKAKN